MATYDHYTTPVPPGTWDVPAAGATRFSWEYDDGREPAARPVPAGQGQAVGRGQADRLDVCRSIRATSWAARRVQPDLRLPALGRCCPQAERDELGHHLSAWLFSQFLHGEQGALTVAARIVESVPDMDSKFYAATQVMDEARHVELFARFMQEKIGLYYPVNPDLAKLLADALSDSRWDMPYLGMQVLIEGLALAAFGVHRDMSNNPLVKQLLAYVMQDEARHVAFGRLALRDYYKELTTAERAEREEFVVEGCYLMRDRFLARRSGSGWASTSQECVEFTEHSPVQQAFRTLLFSRIVPCVKDIGLWGQKVQQRLRRHGRARRRRGRPRRADAGRRGDRRAGRRAEVRGRAGRAAQPRWTTRSPRAPRRARPSGRGRAGRCGRPSSRTCRAPRRRAGWRPSTGTGRGRACGRGSTAAPGAAASGSACPPRR